AVDVMRADDVGVVEGGDGAGLAVEALEVGGVLRVLEREDLDGHPAAHGDVLAQEDLAHAAGPEVLEEPVLAVDGEAARLAEEELFGLESGEKTGLEHALGHGPGPVRLLAAGLEGGKESVEVLLFDQAAFFHGFQERLDGGEFGHSFTLARTSGAHNRLSEDFVMSDGLVPSQRNGTNSPTLIITRRGLMSGKF